MTFLVDANILSELTKQSPHQGVVNWFRTNEAESAVDAIILGEIFAGILALPRGRKRAQLLHWFDSVVDTIQCLPFDATTSRCWAKLIVDLKAKGKSMPVIESLIAATALTHGLILATRNVRDFQHTGIKIVDPFDEAT
jgi:predicted nucleic acid-binding protein